MVQKFEYIEEMDLMCICSFDSYFDPNVDDEARENEIII